MATNTPTTRPSHVEAHQAVPDCTGCGVTEPRLDGGKDAVPRHRVLEPRETTLVPPHPEATHRTALLPPYPAAARRSALPLPCPAAAPPASPASRLRGVPPFPARFSLSRQLPATSWHDAAIQGRPRPPSAGLLPRPVTKDEKNSRSGEL